jgi:hypothetical protein
MSETENPLVGYFRKPEIYIELPSAGQYYPPGTIDLSPTGEVGIFPMTARDELVMKTPDALLNGSSTVEVIRSCVPAIKDPWVIPSVDLDAILVGIRIATYGDEMGVTSTCPNCSINNEFEINLGQLIDQLDHWHFETKLEVDDLVLHFKPLNYKEMNTESLRQFEENKIMRIVNDGDLSDEQKQEAFNDAFLKLTVHTVDLIGKTIYQVDSPNGSTDNRQHIEEFVRNASSKIFKSIQDHLDQQRINNSFSSMKGKCTECEHEYEAPITFDNSNFFG